jgi:hypothetical protein
MMIASCYRSFVPESYRIKISRAEKKKFNTMSESSAPETFPESELDPLNNFGKLADMIP